MPLAYRSSDNPTSVYAPGLAGTPRPLTRCRAHCRGRISAVSGSPPRCCPNHLIPGGNSPPLGVSRARGRHQGSPTPPVTTVVAADHREPSVTVGLARPRQARAPRLRLLSPTARPGRPSLDHRLPTRRSHRFRINCPAPATGCTANDPLRPLRRRRPRRPRARAAAAVTPAGRRTRVGRTWRGNPSRVPWSSAGVPAEGHRSPDPGRSTRATASGSGRSRRAGRWLEPHRRRVSALLLPPARSTCRPLLRVDMARVDRHAHSPPEERPPPPPQLPSPRTIRPYARTASSAKPFFRAFHEWAIDPVENSPRRETSKQEPRNTHERTIISIAIPRVRLSRRNPQFRREFRESPS
jgi:hypothetical protein